MSNSEIKSKRTEAQNNSLHLYLSWVAREMCNMGLTMQDVVKAITKVEIIPTTTSLKEIVWREIQKVVVQKNSTTELSKTEVDEVYTVMSMWLSKNFGIDIPFPHDPDRIDNYIHPSLLKK